MTAVPPPVPPEIVRRAAVALHGALDGSGAGDPLCEDCWGDATTVLRAVYGDIVEAARRDRDAEIKRLRAAVAELREQIGGDCIGCNHNDGPDECCPMHGRTLVDWMEIADRVIGRENDLRAELEADRERAVEAARRDALTEAVERIKDWRVTDTYPASYGLRLAAEVVTGLRDATAPRTAPNATLSDQDTLPRTPATPGTVSGHSGPREEDSETYTVSEIRAAFAAASPDDWGVPCHYETTMLLALRGEYATEDPA